MRSRGGGSILTITSSSVKEPIDVLILSNVMRSGTTSLVKSLSLQIACDGIRINNLMPGRIETERLKTIDLKTAEKNKINWQSEILTAGGTDTSGIQRMTPGGSIAGAISIPTRHIHQVIEMVHKEDVENAVLLLKKCLENMGSFKWDYSSQ